VRADVGAGAVVAVVGGEPAAEADGRAEQEVLLGADDEVHDRITVFAAGIAVAVGGGLLGDEGRRGFAHVGRRQRYNVFIYPHILPIP
jgi:hypothetical protein